MTEEAINIVRWNIKAIQHQVQKVGGPQITDTQVEQLIAGVLQFLEPMPEKQKETVSS